MSGKQWTIDGITHCLPHSVTRQRFLSEVNLAPLDGLPDVLARWIDVAQTWVDASPRLEKLRTYYAEHGQLPEELSVGVDITSELLKGQGKGRGAA